MAIRGLCRRVLLLAVAAVGAACAPPRAPVAGARDAALRDHVAAAGEASPAAELPAEPTLDAYLRHGALHSPELRALFEEWRAALERVPQVTALPEPTLGYAYYVEQVETRAGPQRHRLMLQQKLPWFGTLRLRGDVAQAEARAAYERLEAARLALGHRVRDAYYELYYLARAIDITRENVQLLEYVESVARSLYRVKRAEYADVIRTQVELDKLRDQLATLEDTRRPIAARLNAALDRPPGAPVPWPKAMPHERLAAADAEVLAWMRESSPELEAIEAEIARQGSAVELARKGYYPDFGVGVSYIETGHAAVHNSDSGKDPVIVELMVELPIWRSKYAAAEREARARLRSARHALAARRNALTSDIELALFKLRDADRKISLYTGTLLPRAEQGLKATETAYKGAKASLTDLIDAERVLLAFRLARERALADHAQRLAELEALVGRDLPTSPVPMKKPETKTTEDKGKKTGDGPDKKEKQ